MKTLKTILKFLFALGFILAGANHFYNAAFYLRMMPPIFPAPLFLVYLSGVFEILLGALLLVPKWSWMAAWGLIALLITVFPANVYMALNPELFPEFSTRALYIRLPMQLILIAWASFYTKRPDEHESKELEDE